MMGLDFEIRPAVIDEEQVERQVTAADPVEVALSVARAKVNAIADSVSTVIGADTVVWLDGMSLGKPSGTDGAVRMLSNLSGKRHEVVTGLVVSAGNRRWEGYQRSSVAMRPATPSEIEEYAGTGEPLDKAGGYGIQGRGADFVESAHGCFLNIMGLPVCVLEAILQAAGWARLHQDPAVSCLKVTRQIFDEIPGDGFRLPAHPPTPEVLSAIRLVGE